MSRKFQEVKAELSRRGKWLGSVVGGFVRYHGVPTNAQAIQHFRFQIGRYWHHALRMRGSRRRVTWERMYRLIDLQPPFAIPIL